VVGVVDGRPSGERVETPVDEDSELGSCVPLRKRVAVQGFEGRLVVRGCLGGAHGTQRDESDCYGGKRFHFGRGLERESQE